MAWRKYNNNPCGKVDGDCAIRAISVALVIPWYESFDILCEEARRQCDMPSSNAVWGAVLRRYGFKRYALSNSCPDCYTAMQFAADHPNGVFVLAFSGHVATMIDGTIYDSWDSESEVPIYFYRR